MQELQLAYIDPGAGSFLVQALVAAAAGLAVASRHYWSQIRGFFGRAQQPPPADTAGRHRRSQARGNQRERRVRSGPAHMKAASRA
jgi:hypothetical protein